MTAAPPPAAVAAAPPPVPPGAAPAAAAGAAGVAAAAPRPCAIAEGQRSDKDRAAQPRRHGAVREIVEVSEFGLATDEIT